MLPVRDLFIFSLGVIAVLSETWNFEIKTRNELYAGTDSKIQITVNGSRQTQSFELHGEFERGSLDVFTFDTSFGTPLEITILHNGYGLYSEWKLDYLTMWEMSNEADKRTFHCNCWLNGKTKTFTVPQQLHADATSTTVNSLLTTSTQGQKSTEAATTVPSVTSRPNVETTAPLTLTTGMMNATDRPRSSTDATSTTVESLLATTQEQKSIASATTNVTSRPNAETTVALTLTTGMIKTTDRPRSSTETSPPKRETTMTGDPRVSSPDTTSPTQMYPKSMNITNHGFCFLVCPQNQTMEELMKMVSKLKAELKVEKKVTNTYIRSRKSVNDKRTSSAAIGYTAVIILTTVGLGIVALDLPRLIQSARLIRENIKTKTSYRRKQVV